MSVQLSFILILQFISKYINNIVYILFHINSDNPFNIILKHLVWFEYIWAMLWLQWGNIPCYVNSMSIQPIDISIQSVNCIYFSLTRRSSKL